MVINRELNKEEFYRLLELAPEKEADDLIDYTRQIGKKPWDFFQESKLVDWGILIDGVPIYYACVYEEGDDVYRIWTVRKKDIREQFTLYKLCKRKLAQVTRIYSPIQAINYTHNKLEAKWNMRLGFLPYKIENNLVYYRLSNHKGG